MTEETLKEAIELIQAATPKKAPEGLHSLTYASGLRVVKHEALPDDTIYVGKKLFDLLFSINKDERKGPPPCQTL